MAVQHAPLPPEYEKIAKNIVNAAYTVHKNLGPFLINFNVPIIKQGIKRVIL